MCNATDQHARESDSSKVINQQREEKVKNRKVFDGKNVFVW